MNTVQFTRTTAAAAIVLLSAACGSDHGADRPEAPPDPALVAQGKQMHDLQVTAGYYASLPGESRRHLSCRVVDQLEPPVQAHAIEGLLMGAPG